MKVRLIKAMGMSALAFAMFSGATSRAAVEQVDTNFGAGGDAGLYNDDGIIGQAFADTTNLSIYSMDVRLLTEGDGGFTERFRAGIVRLDLSGLTSNLSDLLSAGLKIQNASQSREITIYGLNDGNAGEMWDESAITWNTTPGLTPNPTYDPIYEVAGQVDTGVWTELGWWTPMGPGSGGTTTEFSTTFLSTENPAGWTDEEAGFADEYFDVDPNFNTNLVDYLKTDTDDSVTLLFMISERLGPANGGSIAFRTKEYYNNNPGTALTAPTLVLSFNDAVAIPGDLNGDGYVGLDDLQPILDHWNQNVTPGDASMGDIAGPGGTGPDGYVGLDDLQPVLDHWNEGVLPTPSAIPEPASLALLSLGGLAVLRRR